MEEDTTYKKLPVDERVVHQLWKARVHGYEELTKHFQQIADEKSSEFAKYLGLVKKFVIDSNAISQEKGLETTLAYVENYAMAGKTVGEVMSGIVAKCIAAPKAKTKDLATQITLMFIEIGKQEAVLEELLKGMDLKNPKIVSACIVTTTLALKEFGTKVITVKSIVKKIPTLLADRDKSVRDECKAMVVEIYRWVGEAFRPQLINLQPVQVAELETEFAKLPKETARPTRLLRSEQAKQSKMETDMAAAADGDSDENYEAGGQGCSADDLVDPVNILSKLPADFYEKIESKKWQDRKESLELLATLTNVPKLESGDYSDLLRALKKVINKDSNVMVVALAGKCLAHLATGLKKRFQIYACVCVPALLEKFREKKQNVVTALREALDAVFLSTNVEAILEDVLEALNNKNPAVKSETALFLARAFSRCPPANLNKKILKAYTGALLKALNEPDPGVRDSAAEAIGTAMKLVSEKAIAPFIAEVDNLKMAKIKECANNAVILVEIIAPKKERPVTAPVKTTASNANQTTSKTGPKNVKRPSTASTVQKKPIPIVAATSKKGKVMKTELELSPEQIDEIASQHFDSETLNSLTDSMWKTRLIAVEKFQQSVTLLDLGSVSTQVLVGILCKKPGLKDTNVMVLKCKLEALKVIADIHKFTLVSANMCLNDVIDKFGDAKNSENAWEVLTAIAESVRLEHVGNTVLDYAFVQKNPKVQQEAFQWLANAVLEFGLTMNKKTVIDACQKGLSATNPGVRTAAIKLLGTLYLYMGAQLYTYFENERSTIKQQIFAEFEKYENEQPPEPIRGLALMKSDSNQNLDALDEETETVAEIAAPESPVARVDISGQITDTFINELTDKNWKTRNEALQKLETILNESKHIQSNIGDLANALAQRLVDSNGKIAQATIQICQTLATAMGPSCKQYIRILFPGFLQSLGDNKNWIRGASLNCINTWGDICGYKEFFEGEIIAEALKTSSTCLRAELWAWLADKLAKLPLKSVPREELLACTPILYMNLEDRNADIRKNAQDAVLAFMIHLGYECMCKQVDKLKPGAKNVILPILEKTRPSLPARPVVKDDKPTGKTTRMSTAVKTGSASAKPTVNKAKNKTPVTVTRNKKEEDIDNSPLFVINNLKHQRVIDEQKLRILKWNFTQPREEFFELLKDQMAAANVNKTLIANMFHADFKFHLKAIDSLVEDISGNHEALVSNLDLVLKWLTLRFFDTNPSVLLKGLEYLQIVFAMLIENQHNLLESEASAFIPYLILKVGDPKDAVRHGVRSLFKQIIHVYPANRLFSYIMEGLKSKNARQRTECLETLSSLIEEVGISVCQPSAIKEIAKQISDRDNSVRNAALNCIVQTYFIEGDKIYKMIGQISDKDHSLLEERIKRSKKLPGSGGSGAGSGASGSASSGASAGAGAGAKSNRISHHPSSAVPARVTSPVSSRESSDDEMQKLPMPVESKMSPLQNNSAELSSPHQTTPQPSSSSSSPPTESPAIKPFNLDPEFLKQLEKEPVIVRKPKLIEIDLSFLNEEISTKQQNPKVVPISLPKRIVSVQPMTRTTSPSNLQNALSQNYRSNITDSGKQIEKLIQDMANVDMKVAFYAIGQLEILLRPSAAPYSLMMEYEDQYLAAIVVQLKRLLQTNTDLDGGNTKEKVAEFARYYRAFFTALATLYDTKMLGRRVSKNVLKDMLYQLITLLESKKLDSFESSDAYYRVVNVECIDIIQYSDHTNIVCALIELLDESLSSSAPCRERFVELTMKCLWKVIKTIQAWTDDLDYDIILYEIHEFFRHFPSSWWRQRQDTPLRTIKTIVHSMAKMKGTSLLNHLTKIDNLNESELQTYILKLLKSLKLEEVKQIPLKNETKRHPLTRSTHAVLSDIFQKIGSKEATKEGLTLLYDFKQKHPEAEIEPYLKKSSPFFQEYIEKGLREIEIVRKLAIPQTEIGDGDHMDINADYWMERLRMWRNIASGAEHPSEPNVHVQNLIDLNISNDKEFRKLPADSNEVTKRLDDIKRQVQMLKLENPITDNKQ